MSEITYVEGSLADILKSYPYSKDLVLSRTSSMSLTLAFNDGEGGWGMWPKASSIQVVLILEDDTPIGWSWVFQTKMHDKRKLIFWVYIDEDSREEGYGSILYNKAIDRARQFHRALRVEPWDKRSSQFFSKLDAKSKYGDRKVVPY